MGVFRAYIAFFTIKKGVIGFQFLADLKSLPIFKNSAPFCSRIGLVSLILNFLRRVKPAVAFWGGGREQIFNQTAAIRF